MNVYDVSNGDGPIVLGQPHGGTFVPPDIADRLNDTGKTLADTDWHISRLFEGLLPDATVVRSNVHRYVIDANRDPEGASLYPGQNTTTLVPLTDFDGRPIWSAGKEPTEDEIAARRTSYHTPYHDALRAALDRVRAKHGVAILFDCHSIRSNIPFLFEGELPVFNTGTNLGVTCAPEIEVVVADVAQASGMDAVLNGRFKGGWTTRHYGKPRAGIHAIQMEIAQRAYMDEVAPWTYRPDRAAQLRPHLKAILHKLSEIACSGGLTRQGDPT
ncbi:N-formylglutamate deformylase [Shimia sp. W99]